MLDCFSVIVCICTDLSWSGLRNILRLPTWVHSFRQPFHLLKHSHTHLYTGNLNSISDGVSEMISLSKYEIENKHKGQDLGSVGGEGWGVLTISDSKNSATLHALCAGALSCRSLRCLCSVFIISKVFKSTRPLCLNWNFKIKKPAK